ncbi:MAG: hypothetical protein ISS87_00730 [Candidatus Pacebacteria bacterium]|nr:hypothetical protein [Candidatus Paceibacterota bacterium]
MKKIIFALILIFIIFSVLVLLSMSSLVKIPVFSNIFYSYKIGDLGIENTQLAAYNLSQKLGFSPSGQKIGNFLPGPKTINASDIEVSSWINMLCKEFPEMFPIKDFQIKFENGKIISSAHIFDPIEADITVFAAVSKKDEKSINVKFEKVYLGNILAPENIRKMLEQKAEQDINKILGQVGDLRIDKLEILNREISFVGIFPFWFPGDEYITF